MKRKILLIDDDQSMIKLLQFVLGQQYEVLSQNDPVKALYIIENLELDAVVCDISMPQMDGYEIISYIRNQMKDSHTPIVMLSSKDSSADKIRCLEDGADDYMVKPFNPEELKVRLKAIFRRMDVMMVNQ